MGLDNDVGSIKKQTIMVICSSISLWKSAFKSSLVWYSLYGARQTARLIQRAASIRRRYKHSYLQSAISPRPTAHSCIIQCPVCSSSPPPSTLFALKDRLDRINLFRERRISLFVLVRFFARTYRVNASVNYSIVRLHSQSAEVPAFKSN